MYVKKYFSGIIISCCVVMLWNCGDKKDAVDDTAFTKVDSLTDTYLALQDSMLRVWNVMINDDNGKIKSMHNLVHELMVSGKNNNNEALLSIEQRLEQLTSLRYSQKTMANTDVVEEYDFASTSLVSELISIAEARPEFQYNTTIQKLVDEVNAADQRVNNYRDEYDMIALVYNDFVERNKAYFKEINPTDSIVTRPTFNMEAEE